MSKRTRRRNGQASPTLELSARDGVIVLTGAVVFDTAAEGLKRALALLPATGPLVFDLSGVTQTDSAALALIVEWQRAAMQRGATLELRGLPPQLRALAAATGLDEFCGH